ncbi:hypothetical protein [Haloarcula montana]|uniref:hypothetical protein n=1 Tax=Haloarcula montana TaxID=3111776 RepID=UPI002D771774|nr:hypothetical protein [Haloarcula sp. GH36]
MKRRRFLTVTGVTAVGSLGGCLSGRLNSTTSIDFELWNNTADSHTVDVTIRDSGEEAVLKQIYEIDQAGSGSTPGGTVIRETGIADVTSEEVFDAVAILDNELRSEHQFQAMCVNSETPSVFIIELDAGKETNLEFNQSTCS